MTVIIGSARIDERGKAYGGKAGDQTGREVSKQEFYIHPKGWIVARLIDPVAAEKNAACMDYACDNDNIGYDQWERLGVWKNGTHSKKPTEADCSALVRTCIFEATGVDVGDIRTITMEKALTKSGLFQPLKQYKKGMKLYDGDVLFTGHLGNPVSGHTVIVVKGYKRKSGPTTTTTPTTVEEKPVEQPVVTAPKYQEGKIYTLQVELNIRTGPGTDYSIKKPSQWTVDARKHDDNGNGQLDKGTRVSCKATKKVGSATWMQIPSGWVCAISSQGKVYIR